METRILFITDPVHSLNLKKDTSLFMIEYLQSIDSESYQCQMNDIFFIDNTVKAKACRISINSNKIEKDEKYEDIDLNNFQYVFMRKDPPVDTDYSNTLHLLDLAQEAGAKVYNNPQAVKKFNEKIFALYFNKYIPSTLITSKLEDIKSFGKKYNEIVVKPLDGMGGESIYKFSDIQFDEEAIIKELTNDGSRNIVAQEFLKEIYDGDFRILIINGKPFHKTLARVPQDGNFKGNLAAGGKGIAQDLKPHQESVAKEIGSILMDHGIVFAGLDMIGSKVTEINVTSPTCAREIFEQTGENPVQELFNHL